MAILCCDVTEETAVFRAGRGGYDDTLNNRDYILRGVTQFIPSASQAADTGRWLPARQAAFQEWQRLHKSDMVVADIKARTAALMARYVSPAVPPKYSELKRQSDALDPARREQAEMSISGGIKSLQAGNYREARNEFYDGLQIDSANVSGNYYWALMSKQDADAPMEALFMDRVVTMAPGTELAAKASVALQTLPAVEKPDAALPPVIWRVPGAPSELWDAPVAPHMEIIPAGEFTMGANVMFEAPRHRVRIDHPFAIGKFDVTRGEFAAFVAETHYKQKNGQGCFGPGAHFSFTALPDRTWENPGFPQSDDDPVVCVDWDDDVAYADWLSRKTGAHYWLPSEAEWEYAARADTTTAYYWGETANIGKTEPRVLAARPNPFHLYDMAGIVSQWTSDCMNTSYYGAPTDGSSWQTGNCRNHISRGGGNWTTGIETTASRSWDGPDYRASNIDFRLARDL